MKTINIFMVGMLAIFIVIGGLMLLNYNTQQNKVIATNSLKEVVNYAEEDEVCTITDYAYDYTAEDFGGLLGKVTKITYRSDYGIQKIIGEVTFLSTDGFYVQVQKYFMDLRIDYKDVADIQVIKWEAVK